MRTRWAIVVQALAWTVILAVGTALCLGVLVPRLAGATPYTVLTASMRPDLAPGTLVVVRPVPIDAVAVGDLVTYQRRSGEPTVVTHRVVATGLRADGQVVLTTRGDANDVPDAEPVRAEQVRGRVWYAVPHLGRVGAVLDGRQRQGAVHLVAAGLTAYAGWMLLGAFRDRRATTRTPSSGIHRPEKEEAR